MKNYLEKLYSVCDICKTFQETQSNKPINNLIWYTTWILRILSFKRKKQKTSDKYDVDSQCTNERMEKPSVPL